MVIACTAGVEVGLIALELVPLDEVDELEPDVPTAGAHAAAPASVSDSAAVRLRESMRMR